MSIQGLYTWLAGEAKWAIFIVLIVVLIVTAYKRAWLEAIGTLVGLSLMAVIIVKPDLILSVGSWLGGLIGLN